MHEFLTCHEALTTSRWTGKVRRLDRTEWGNREAYNDEIDPILAREWSEIVAVQGIGNARRLFYSTVMNDDFELRRVLSACAEVDQVETATDSMERGLAAVAEEVNQADWD